MEVWRQHTTSGGVEGRAGGTMRRINGAVMVGPPIELGF
jgi:hypothetical protein